MKNICGLGGYSIEEAQKRVEELNKIKKEWIV